MISPHAQRETVFWCTFEQFGCCTFSDGDAQRRKQEHEIDKRPSSVNRVARCSVCPVKGTPRIHELPYETGREEVEVSRCGRLGLL
jgi:hypothetical protein